MTMFLVDLASYQQGIDLGKVHAAGSRAVNIKTSQGNWYTWPAAAGYADTARTLGLGVCTFHWLDSSASGAAQAAIAYQRMREVGGPDGMAHQCDCEDPTRPATWTIWRDYVTAMQDLLGRHIAAYTGDWWWTAPGRNWPGASITPYLWAAPNNGYLTGYPGDQSPAWHAGYGGWGDYALLQYAVSPIVGAGGGDLSKTAIRDPAVWAALTGGSVSDWSGLGAPKNMPYSADVASVDVHSVLRTGDRTGWSDTDGGGWWIVKQIRGIRADLAAVAAGITDLLGRAPAVFTDDQVAALAASVGDRLVAATDNPLGDADKPAIVAAVKQALREGTAGA